MEAFELRLWDGRLGRWLSPDPYGEFFSPYLGMGNLPTLAIDIDGGRIIVGINVNGFVIQYEYRDGDFYSLVSGEKINHIPSKFHNDVKKAFDEISKGSYGRSIVKTMQMQYSDYMIAYVAEEMVTAAHRKVMVDPMLKVKTYLSVGLEDSPFFVSFVHELGHLFGHKNGRGDNTFWMRVPGGKGFTRHEEYASLIENKIRNEHKLNFRTHYSYMTFEDGSVEPIEKSRLLQMNHVETYLTKAENFYKFQFSNMLSRGADMEYKNVSVSPRDF